MENESILVGITFRKFESDSTYGLITRLIYMKYIKMLGCTIYKVDACIMSQEVLWVNFTKCSQSLENCSWTFLKLP